MRAESAPRRIRLLVSGAGRNGYGESGLGNGYPVRLGYRRVGDFADSLIVLHGGPGLTLEYLAENLSPLAQEHSVIFYDQRGARALRHYMQCGIRTACPQSY